MEPYWPSKDVLEAGRRALPERKPSKKLLGYLKKYQHDLLTTGTPEGLPSFATQRNTLIATLRQMFAGGQGYHQTIIGRGVDLPKFWELMLSMDFVSHEIKLANNIGYDDREIATGVRSTVEAPFAEVTIIGDDLKHAVASEPKPAPIVTAADNPIVTLPTAEHRINVRSYDAPLGTLHFGGCEIQIVRQKKRQGSAVGETAQGSAMRKLFKDVNTLRNGVPLHAIISVRKDNFDSKKRKRATNHLDEINRKVEKETGVPKLIIYDQVKYYIDKSYLI